MKHVKPVISAPLPFAISITLSNLLIEVTEPSKDVKILLNFTIHNFGVLM